MSARVPGTSLSLSVSGTFTALPYIMDGPQGFSFTHLYQFGVELVGAKAELVQTYQDGDGDSGTSRFAWRATVPGGDEADIVETGDDHTYTYIRTSGDPVVELDESPLTTTWSIACSGLVIRRTHETDPPSRRQHMHPVDASAYDRWYITPDFQVTVTVGDVVLASPVRRDWPAYDGMTDEEIGDVAIDTRLWVSQRNDTWRAVARGYDLTEISIGSTNLDGMLFRHYGGDSGSEPCGYIWEGSGDTLTSSAPTDTVNSVSGSGGTVGFGLPYLYTWDLGCSLWPGGDELDPDVWAGYRERVSDDDGCHYVAVSYPMSALPDGGDSVPVVDTSFVIDETDWCAAAYDPRGNNPWFSVTIDEEWALRRWLCPGAAVDYAEGAATETLHDRYLTLYVPGLNAGVVGGSQVIGAVETDEASCLPLAPARAGDRWQVTGDVTVSPAATLSSPRWTIAAEGSGTVSYEPVTRLWDRLALLPQLDAPKNWLWPWHLSPAGQGQDLVSDPYDEREPDWAEDLWHWGAASYLRLSLARSAALALNLRLVVDYSVIAVSDPWYTCGGLRAEEWEYTRTQGQAAYSVTLADTDETVNIDLLCPDDGSLPRYYVVDRVTIEGLDNPTTADIDVTLTALALVSDPGSDHTGRVATPDPRLVCHTLETWDYLTDWQGQSLARDGNIRLLEWPGDPWLNQGPERGRGYIQPLVHCPTSGLADLLHYARPVTDLATAGRLPGVDAAVDAAGMVEAAGPGGATETIAAPVMYWGANHLWEATDGEAVDLRASVHVLRWSPAQYSNSVLYGRKWLGGAAWGLLRTTGGGKRIIQGSDEAATARWVIWRRVVAYRDSDGAPIAAPSGAPAVGGYELVEHGAVNDRLDQHGLFVTPGLPPSRSRIWNAARGSNPADHTDTVDVEYLLQVWDGDDPWEEYDLDDPTEYAGMLKDQRLISQARFTIASRRLTTIALYGPSAERGGLAMVYTPWGTTAICRGAGLRWAGEPGGGAAGLLVDHYSQHVVGGGWPDETVQVHPGRWRAGLMEHTGGLLWLAAESDGDIVLMVTTARGEEAEDVDTLAGHTDPVLVRDPHTQGGWLLSRRTSDGALVLHALARATADGEPELAQVAELGSCDPGCGGLTVLADGAMLAARVEAGVIHLHRSMDGGRTWEALTA